METQHLEPATMSFFSRIFSQDNPNEVMQPLYQAIVAEGRRLAWYEQGEVPDSIDGRFDMIAAIFSLVVIRLEDEREQAQNLAWLTEIFIRDMDGQIRQIGISDVVVGKHVGRMMGALGGRMGAYREALQGKEDLNEALIRNLYRGNSPGQSAVEFVATKIRLFETQLAELSSADIISGQLPVAAS